MCLIGLNDDHEELEELRICSIGLNEIDEVVEVLYGELPN